MKRDKRVIKAPASGHSRNLDSPARRRTNACWLRAQIAGLQSSIAHSGGWTLAAVRLALGDLFNGEPWRGGR